mmetsp:Transcript_19364/g.42848  ORF Transcript_19364/g.42848 Transcript_19364/m.42848 type:complete len:220 (+) Transcript_19364:2299-2958(+)
MMVTSPDSKFASLMVYNSGLTGVSISSCRRASIFSSMADSSSSSSFCSVMANSSSANSRKTAASVRPWSPLRTYFCGFTFSSPDRLLPCLSSMISHFIKRFLRSAARSIFSSESDSSEEPDVYSEDESDPESESDPEPLSLLEELDLDPEEDFEPLEELPLPPLLEPSDSSESLALSLSLSSPPSSRNSSGDFRHCSTSAATFSILLPLRTFARRALKA